MIVDFNKDDTTRLIWYAYMDKLNLRLKELETVNEYHYNYYNASNNNWKEWIKTQIALDFEGDINTGVLKFKNNELMMELVLTYGY